MATALTNVFLYLTRRDKSGVRVLAKFTGRPQMAVRVEELAPLQLPYGWLEQLDQIIFDSRMLWEPWIESSDNYNELKSSLKIRGYTNVPMNLQIEFQPAISSAPLVNLNYLPIKKFMIRKRSS